MDPGLIRALVVDDNAYARAFCIAALNQLGIAQSEEASGGAEAILRLIGGGIDLVLLYWYMPDITGAGILQVLRDPRFGRAVMTRVIVMTAYPSSDNIKRARRFSVDAILPKPFSRVDLARTLDRFMFEQAPETVYV